MRWLKKKKYKIQKSKLIVAAEPMAPYGSSSGQEPITFEKVWQMHLETEKKFQETDKKIKELATLFTNQWGKLVESLVEGKLVELLRGRGMLVEGCSGREERGHEGEFMEIDLKAVNTTDVVIIEVKTTLREKDVDKFVSKLHRFKQFFHEYEHYRVTGGVAFMKRAEGPERYAQKKGLFTIRATGDSASITNPPDFKPQVY